MPLPSSGWIQFIREAIYVNYIVIDKHDNTCYMPGALPSAHTPTEFM